MMNNISLIGRLTRNPELRYTQTQKAVCEFTLACNRIGEGADFITCVCWNKQAENLNKYQKQGSLIGVVGRLTTDTYEDKDGNKRYKTYVLVNELEYLTPKGQKETVEQTNCETFQQAMNDNRNPFEEFGEQITIDENSLPF